MSLKKFDLHIHSCYSKDSVSKPKDIVKFAIKKGLGGIAITDHNTIKGSLETQKIAKKINPDFIVILGSEIRTKQGELLAYDIQEEIPKGLSFEETFELIKEQGGLCIIPHPFSNYFLRPLSKRWDKNIFKKVDGIEVFNSGNLKIGNKKAMFVAKKLNLPVTAGSDAHVIDSIGLAGIICEDPLKDIKKKRVEIFGKYRPFTHWIKNYYLRVRSLKILLALKIKY